MYTTGKEAGYIDKTGRMVIKPSNFNIEYSIFSEGLATTNAKGLCGYMDRSGKIVIQPRYERCDDFSEDRASVTVREKCGYIDRTGRLVIPLQFDSYGPFKKGAAMVQIRDSKDWHGTYLGYINKSGGLVFGPSK